MKNLMNEFNRTIAIGFLGLILTVPCFAQGTTAPATNNDHGTQQTSFPDDSSAAAPIENATPAGSETTTAPTSQVVNNYVTTPVTYRYVTVSSGHYRRIAIRRGVSRAFVNRKVAEGVRESKRYANGIGASALAKSKQYTDDSVAPIAKYQDAHKGDLAAAMAATAAALALGTWGFWLALLALLVAIAALVAALRRNRQSASQQMAQDPIMIGHRHDYMLNGGGCHALPCEGNGGTAGAYTRNTINLPAGNGRV